MMESAAISPKDFAHHSLLVVASAVLSGNPAPDDLIPTLPHALTTAHTKAVFRKKPLLGAVGGTFERLVSQFAGDDFHQRNIR